MSNKIAHETYREQLPEERCGTCEYSMRPWFGCELCCEQRGFLTVAQYGYCDVWKEDDDR